MVTSVRDNERVLRCVPDVLRSTFGRVEEAMLCDAVGWQRSGTRARGGSRQVGQGIMDVLGSMFYGHACSAESGGGRQRIGEGRVGPARQEESVEEK
jgi:hypothetical protein